MLVIADGVTGTPKFGGDPLVSGVFDHPDFFSVFDFPADLATELEIQPHLVDTPGFIGFHQDTVFGILDQVIQLPGAGHETKIIYSDHGDAGKPIGPATTAALVFTDFQGVFAVGLITGEHTVLDDVPALGPDRVIVITDRGQSARDRAVGDQVDDLRTVT